ncbi:hypothetical protein CRG98_007480 [Punica granatum]|uniref:Uncharacterized protein n=1 Tax=Punica granatum TaxID=22663 RepID=A0A2I0KUS5_PUNGR|nr:hypothetical protein CRG98_007480 [Punica granatum]
MAEDGWDLIFSRKRDGACAYCCGWEGYALFVELSLSAFAVKGLDLLLEGRNPHAVNAGLKPDAGPKPNAVNAGPEPHAGPKPNVVGQPSVHSSPCHGRRVKAADGLPAKVGTTHRSCGVGGRDGLGFWSQCISLWRSEDRRWSTREGWHNSLVVRGGWPGWTASGHNTSRHGEVKTVGGLPAKVGTTRLLCRVGGRDGRSLVTARLAVER